MSEFDGVRADIQICKECGNRTYVYNTRTYGHGRLTRQRRCKVCGYKFVTYKITKEEYEALLNIDNNG